MSIFKYFFTKKDYLIPFDLSFLKTDIHSHLIPGIDDGSKSVDDTIFLAKGLQKIGYKKIITTPHVMSTHYKNTPKNIKSGLLKIKKAFIDNNINLNIEVGAEYYIDYDFINKISNKELLTFGDNYVLIEFSFIEPPRNIKNIIFELQVNGYKPILAHPERYIYWLNDKKTLFKLKDSDVLFQTNLLSLMGYYGKESEKMAKMLLQNNMIEWLGTDLHNEHQLTILKKYKIKESIAELINKTPFLNQTI